MGHDATRPTSTDANRPNGTWVLADDVERYGIAAVMLAQLRWLTAEARHVNWVRRDGHLWVAYADNEWADVVGLSTDQARRARRKLTDAGAIASAVFKKDGIPTVHVRLTSGDSAQSDSAIPPNENGDSAESLDSAIPPNPPLYETEETTTGTNARLTAARDDGPPDRFLATWEHYPRKLNRKGAARAWTATIRRGADPDDLHTATVHYAQIRSGEDDRHTMHGTTFFGPDERWRDYLDPPATPRRARRKPSKGEVALAHLAEIEGRPVWALELVR